MTMRRKVERERRREAALERDLREEESDASEEELYREVVERRGNDGKKLGKGGKRRSSGKKNRHKDAWVPAKTVPSKPGSRSVSPAVRRANIEGGEGRGEGGDASYDQAMRPYSQAQRMAGLVSTTTGSILSETTSGKPPERGQAGKSRRRGGSKR